MPVAIQHDGPLWVSVGNNRKDKSWKNTSINWSDLVKRLSKHVKTQETHAEYMAFPKEIQAERKDVGGFVGGVINGGRRLSKKIQSRYLLTLDVDFANAGFWNTFQLLYTNAAFLYGTHKHHPDSPRLRLVMPLSREVFPDEYEAIARQIAGTLDIEVFDPTTFQPERLMYWGSIPSDMTFYSQFQDGDWIDADEVLASYKDWKDSSQWPISKKAKTAIHKAAEKQGSPVEKPGVIGAFCRTYDVPGAIAAFLPDIYETTEAEDRYTYTGGSTAGGLVLYDEGMFAFSHHGTDPTSGKLCNAFDLVRIHKFGMQDEDTDPATPGNKRPSYKSMIDLASRDRECKKEIAKGRRQEIGAAFTEEGDWMETLDTEKKSGKILSTAKNCLIILQNDPKLTGCFGYDLFEHTDTILNNLPWREVKGIEILGDVDEAALRNYFEVNYEIAAPLRIRDAFLENRLSVSYHPVQEYILGCTWDSTERLDTLLIDYFGAEDSVYTRAVTRKALTAAIARIFEPGIKFDNVLTLIGEEGAGKSTFFRQLGGIWYSNSLGPVDSPKIFEQLQGCWIIEIAELAGFRKAEVEQVKHFISKQSDRFRVAYGHRTEVFARQCVFFGTTNTPDFLTSANGNRRFWPVQTNPKEAILDIFTQLTADEVQQIWAEAYISYRMGETIHLNTTLEKLALAKQTEHTEYDDREELIREFLEEPIESEFQEEGATPEYRNKVTITELWCEALRGYRKDMTNYNTKPIHNIMKSLKNWNKIRSVKTKDGHVGTGYERIAKRVSGLN